MSVALVNLLFLLAAAVTGAVAIWWLCGRTDTPPALAEKTTQAQQAAEVLARLQELATRVAVDVDEHSGRVEAINEELTATSGDEVATIVEVVAKLVQANRQMQEKLTTTENKLREQAQELESHAIESRTDALTLLANRRAFDDEISRRLAEFQRHGRTFSLVMIDVDHFKQFNDTHGHQAGDEALRSVGRTLRRRTREMDMVARYGGEEFTIILPGTQIDDARCAARRAREAIEKARFHFDDKALQITVSLGVVEVLPGEDATGLVKRADAALYASKDAGRNCIHWHDGKDVHLADPETLRSREAGSPQAGVDNRTSLEGTEHETIAAAIAAQPEPCDGSLAIDVDQAKPGTARSEPTSNLETRSTFCQQVRARMAEWRRGGSSFSVALAELDQCNQPMSHADSRVYSQGLQAVAELAVATVREMDTVAQYGPGCFALLLPRAELAGAGRVGERLHQTIAKHSPSLGSDHLRLTLSIGVVEVIERDDDTIALLRRAEAALEAARRRGGNCTFYHDGERCVLANTLPETTDALA